MSALRHFERHLLRNYLIGSFVAVFGVGCLFIFETLTFTGIEQLILIGIMAVSVSLMFSLEYMLYSRHVASLRRFFENDIQLAVAADTRKPDLAILDIDHLHRVLTVLRQ